MTLKVHHYNFTAETALADSAEHSLLTATLQCTVNVPCISLSLVRIVLLLKFLQVHTLSKSCFLSSACDVCL